MKIFFKTEKQTMVRFRFGADLGEANAPASASADSPQMSYGELGLGYGEFELMWGYRV